VDTAPIGPAVVLLLVVIPFLNKYPMPAPVSNNNISLDGICKNTLTIPARIIIADITLATEVLSIKLNTKRGVILLY